MCNINSTAECVPYQVTLVETAPDKKVLGKISYKSAVRWLCCVLSVVCTQYCQYAAVLLLLILLSLYSTSTLLSLHSTSTLLVGVFVGVDHLLRPPERCSAPYALL